MSSTSKADIDILNAVKVNRQLIILETNMDKAFDTYVAIITHNISNGLTFSSVEAKAAFNKAQCEYSAAYVAFDKASLEFVTLLDQCQEREL